MAHEDDALSVLLEQERRLVFAHFDHHTAWQIGSALRADAAASDLPVAISIRRAGQVLFHAALPGSSLDNDEWLLRKARVVERYGHSSYYIGCEFRSRGKDFDTGSRLDPTVYSAHGGAFPVTLGGSGWIGSVAVSGLPQRDDHMLVVTHLEAYLRSSGQLTD